MLSQDVDPKTVTYRDIVRLLNSNSDVQELYKCDDSGGWKLYEDVPLNLFATKYGIEARHLERVEKETHHTVGKLDFKNGKEVDIYVTP